MDIKKVLQFIKEHRNTRFYQPVIFQPNVLEIRGFWHNETIALAESICSSIKGKHVLDIGCNTGFFLHMAIEKGAESAMGIDCDPHIVKLSQEIFSLLSLNATIETADINSFVPPKIFDVILMLNVIHVAENPLKCFERFLSYSNLLIIEHEEEHSEYFPVQARYIKHSPRAGGRLLSYFA